MKRNLLIVCFWICLTESCVSQVLKLEGTYITTTADHLGYGWKLNEVYRLNRDSTFNYYWQSDQRDIQSERVLVGKFSVTKDTLKFFVQNDGSNIDSTVYPVFKLKILNEGFKTIEPIRAAGGEKFDVYYYKTNFSNFDSMQIDWLRAAISKRLVIRKDRTVNYRYFAITRDSFLLKDTAFILPVTLYNLFIKRLEDSAWYKPYKFYDKDRSDFTFKIYLKGKYFKHYTQLFSDEFLTFLSTQVIKDRE